MTPNVYSKNAAAPINSAAVDDLGERFRARFGSAPWLIARAPGRANLIGEHTDYSDLPVLPFAIDRAVLVAAQGDDTGVIDAASERFDGAARVVLERGPPASAGPSWHRYLECAARRIAPLARGRGARLLIGGDLPPNGGLSSSSALTLGILAALDAAWKLGLDRDALVDHAISAERDASAEGGAMDQTVIAHSRAGSVLRIDFRPRALTPVALPDSLAFVVASSGEEAPKATAARVRYNERVIGTRLAAALLARRCSVEPGDPPRLRDVSDLDGVGASVESLPEHASVAAVARELDVPATGLARFASSTFDVDAAVPVRSLARHVLGEARRVDQACEALRRGDLEALGALLDASHRSLRDDFGCSTMALDRVCDAMRRAGALGARLTGAGFGGYALAACVRDRARTVIDAAVEATGGPAFEVRASEGLCVIS